MSLLRGLSADLKQIIRDPMLMAIVVLLFSLIVGFRWIIPLLQRYFLDSHDFDLTPYYPLITSCMHIQIAIILGAVYGFLLLEQKDARTLSAIRVSPITLNGYLVRSLSLPMTLTWLLSYASVPIIGITELPWPQHLFYSISSVPFFLIFTFFLATFAQNKVQGFALSKAGGVMLWLPAIAYFVVEPWQWLFALLPSYWPALYTWLGYQESSHQVWVWLAGFAYQIAVAFWLYTRFARQTT